MYPTTKTTTTAAFTTADARLLQLLLQLQQLIRLRVLR